MLHKTQQKLSFESKLFNYESRKIVNDEEISIRPNNIGR